MAVLEAPKTKKLAVEMGLIPKATGDAGSRSPRVGAAPIRVKGSPFWRPEDLFEGGPFPRFLPWEGEVPELSWEGRLYYRLNQLNTQIELFPERDPEGWSRLGFAPRRGETPAHTHRGVGYFAEKQLEKLAARGKWNEAGKAILGSAEVFFVGKFKKSGVGLLEYSIYRESDTRPKRVANYREPVTVDLLAAIFAVNRAAKRYRDAASAQYWASNHGFARRAKITKTHLYELKDRGISAALQTGRIAYEGTHGGFALYRGEGYCYHSTLSPADAVLPVEPLAAALRVEAKPRTAKEPRLKDAVATLEALPAPVGMVAMPPRERFQERGHYRHEADEGDCADFDLEDDGRGLYY